MYQGNTVSRPDAGKGSRSQVLGPAGVYDRVQLVDDRLKFCRDCGILGHHVPGMVRNAVMHEIRTAMAGGIIPLQGIKSCLFKQPVYRGELCLVDLDLEVDHSRRDHGSPVIENDQAVINTGNSSGPVIVNHDCWRGWTDDIGRPAAKAPRYDYRQDEEYQTCRYPFPDTHHSIAVVGW